MPCTSDRRALANGSGEETAAYIPDAITFQTRSFENLFYGSRVSYLFIYFFLFEYINPDPCADESPIWSRAEREDLYLVIWVEQNETTRAVPTWRT